MTVAPADVRVVTDVDEVLEATCTVRHRLDFDRPVDPSVVTRCVEITQQATIGSNQEEWRVAAVFNPDRKLAITEIYREIYEEMVARPFREAGPAALERFGLLPDDLPVGWSYQLALRARRDRVVMATAAMHRAGDLARLLELPDDFTLVAMIPAAYTRGTEFRRALRNPVGDILCFERWGRDA